MKKFLPILNKSKDDKPHEILIHGPIGGSFWSDEGITGLEFTDALNKIPKGEKVIVGVNSQGGAVGEGLAIFNAIKRRADDITVRIDGYALSIASFFPLPASRIIAPPTSIWMIHFAWAFAQGNKNDMRKAADMLDTHDRVLADEYIRKTGKTEREILKALAEETWLTGKEAIEWGLADEEGDNEVALDSIDLRAAINGSKDNPQFKNHRGLVRAMASFAFPQTISAPKQGAGSAGVSPAVAGVSPTTPTNQKQEPTMNRTEIIALLKQWGVEVSDSITDADLKTLLAKGKPEAKREEPKAEGALTRADIDTAVKNAKKEIAHEAAVKAELVRLVTEKRITQKQADNSLAGALKDETVLATLRENPVMPEPAEPVGMQVDITNEDPREIEKAILKTIAPLKVITSDIQAKARGVERARLIQQGWKRLEPALNANTVSTDLKRTVIWQKMIRAFAIKHLSLGAFTTVMGGIRLEGTDKVAVPYFSLATATPTTFVAANGYDTFTDIGNNAKTVTIDKRKYIGLKWTSAELARNPYMDTAMGAVLLVENLAAGVVTDVMSIITEANFGPAVNTDGADAFDSDDVMALKGVADLANWPDSGRSLILNSPYDVNLLQDDALKTASSWGDNQPVREGRIFRIGGFDYYGDSRVPDNGEALQGFIMWKSPILFATSPITPTAEVRSQLTRYEVIVEPTSGATFEYRLWGNPDMDQSREIIECNYGYDLGETAALKRITG